MKLTPMPPWNPQMKPQMKSCMAVNFVSGCVNTVFVFQEWTLSVAWFRLKNLHLFFSIEKSSDIKYCCTVAYLELFLSEADPGCVASLRPQHKKILPIVKGGFKKKSRCLLKRKKRGVGVHFDQGGPPHPSSFPSTHPLHSCYSCHSSIFRWFYIPISKGI